jgi:hypothetical protein
MYFSEKEKKQIICYTWGCNTYKSFSRSVKDWEAASFGIFDALLHFMSVCPVEFIKM